MSSETPNFILPTAYFPEWWNIHTHRCNHHSALPTFQQEHSLGRALLADWGRVGAVNVSAEEKHVKVVPQISNSLCHRLYYAGLPSPVLSAHYLPPEKDCDRNNETTHPSDGSLLDSSTAFDAGYSQLLNDALLGEQASAAFLIGKVQGLIRVNGLALDEKNPKSAKVTECVEQLEQLATEGLGCSTSREQNEILDRILRELYTQNNSEDVAEELLLESTGEPVAKRKRTSIVEKHRRTESGRYVLPSMLSKMYAFRKSNQSDEETRLLAAVDPFLIRLSSRTVNPVFFGHGLLRTCGQNIFWSVPHQNATPRLWLSQLNQSDQLSPISVSLSDLPVSGSRLCELDVRHDDELAPIYNIVSRWDSSSGTNNIALMRIRLSDDGTSAYMEHSVVPSLPSIASSVCIGPWPAGGQWATAGTHSTQSGDKTAYVRLYSLDQSSLYWTGRISLDDHSDGVCAETEGILNALGLPTPPQDPVKSTLDTFMQFIKPNVLPGIRTGSVAGLQMGVRVGFASHPTELCLSTTRRLMLIDTRQCNTACELFSTASHSAAFNSSEYFTFVAPKFIGDIYALVTTPYSTVLVDKRMPGRSVLHTQHSLPGPPVYIDWNYSTSQTRERYEIPELLLASASQYPADVNLVGLNFSAGSGPQLVGPSLTGARITPDLCRAHGELPLRLVKGDSVKNRLLTSLCGLSILPTTDEATHVLALTSNGDVFKHSWAFQESHATELSQINSARTSDWLSDLICRPSETELPYDPKTAQIVDLTELSRLQTSNSASMKTPEKSKSCWKFTDLANHRDFSVASTNSSEHLLSDLKSIWRENDPLQHTAAKQEPSGRTRGGISEARRQEERKHSAMLDSLTLAAKHRLRRFKCLIEHAFIQLNSSTPDE